MTRNSTRFKSTCVRPAQPYFARLLRRCIVTEFVKVLHVGTVTLASFLRCMCPSIRADETTLLLQMSQPRELTACQCRVCGGKIYAYFRGEEKEPFAIECEDCLWRIEYARPEPGEIDAKKREARKILYDAEEQTWRKTGNNCPQCGAEMLYRQRPNRRMPTAIRCSSCEYFPQNAPLKAARKTI